MGFREVDLSLSCLLVLASGIELKHQYQALGRTLHYNLLRFTGCPSVVEKLNTHVKASKKLIDKACNLVLFNFHDFHQPLKEKL